MRGRAERIGGKLAVTSKPGEGTNVTVKVPLEQVLSQWTLKQVSSQ
jgi:signal transduction histidine kinase